MLETIWATILTAWTMLKIIVTNPLLLTIALLGIIGNVTTRKR